MELTVITLFCIIAFSLLQTPCASLRIPVPHSHDHEANEVLPSDLSTLPRKLRFTAHEVTAKQHGGPDTMSHKKQEQMPVPTGKPNNKEKEEMHGSKGTWREWVEGTDTSQYFTMDYSHVKRRRPIHNKSLPVGP